MTDADVDVVLQHEPFRLIKAEYDECSRGADDVEPSARKKAERKLERVRDLIRHDCSLRACKSGEILIREAEYGTSAFFILKGAVQVIFTRLDASLLGREEPKPNGMWRSLGQAFRKCIGPEARDPSKYPQFAKAGARGEIIDQILPPGPPGLTKEEIIEKWPAGVLPCPGVQIVASDLAAGVKTHRWSMTDRVTGDASNRFYRSSNADRSRGALADLMPTSDEPGLHFLEGYPGILHGDNVQRVTQSVLEGEVTDDRFFGEIGALARIERRATVVAGRGAYGDEDEVHLLLEARWQGFRDLMKMIPNFDETVRRRYRLNCKNRVLESGIFSVVELDDDAKEEIHAASTVRLYGDFEWSADYGAVAAKDPSDRLAAEPIIAEEGHELHGVFFLMSGFGRLSRRRGHGEQTLGYIGPKSYDRWENHVGLREAFHNWMFRSSGREPIRQQQSLRAVGYALGVFVPSSVLEKYVFAGLPQDMRPPPFDPTDTQEASSGRDASDGSRDVNRTGLLDLLVESRVMNGRKTMVIDLDRCTRCDDCVRACAATHDNNPRFVRHGLQHGRFMMANACMHCADPVCMIGCPTGAIHRVREGPEIIINDLTCIGCAVCANNCPYHNIRIVPIRDLTGRPIEDFAGRVWQKATKCDLCVDQHGGPACQRACPHDALVRIDTSRIGPLDAWMTR